MSQERYAKWDTMKLPYAFNEAYIEPPATVEGERARRRVAPYEEFLAMVEGGEEVERVSTARSSLRRETKRRFAFWTRHSSAGELRSEWVIWTHILRVAAITVVLVVGWMLFFYLASLRITGVPTWMPLVLAVGGVVGAIYAIVRWRRPGGKTLVGLEQGVCLDCGYMLHETRPAIDPAELDGQWIGPRACPECGAPWPMLPPPVFEG